MKTTLLNSKEVATKTNEDVKNQMRPSIPGKEAKNEPAKDQTPAQTAQVAPAPAAAVKAGDSVAENQQPANTPQPAEAQAVTPQAEPTKKEIREELKAQHVRGLDDTVKLVEQLGKKIAQKNKLSTTIGNLDSFIVTQNDDKDDVAGDSKFMRCELAITDDGGEEFVTKNPFIIAKVVEMVKSLCIEKLAEVEASIVIPQ
ncbi:hypothetical protein FHW88_000400 [Mucilaginibacter sp. SG538B]|uniref:hypothetical protein n=1 Tax=Mucilaginibacter sp. SG538B TaxID=2587021 RepID=UPI00159E302C|nr:hypothetical protein [Mucilaginibacter sp. SG538B]NVM62124.1 hypothetical protein [Mucilaginibacter sp. SG538B]